MSKEIFGLREKIAYCTTEQEIVNLLKVGNSFEFASPRTRASWKNTAFRVLNKLKTSVVDTEPVSNKSVKSKGKRVNN
jgi:hypothetical protein